MVTIAVVKMFSKILMPFAVVSTNAALPFRGIKRLGNSPADLISNVTPSPDKALLT